jgi:hypothetical protein
MADKPAADCVRRRVNIYHHSLERIGERLVSRNQGNLHDA